MKSSYELFKHLDLASRKHRKYFEVYDRIFQKYIDQNITFVEIGILDGGSLDLWKKFFGKNARIIGIDLNPESKKFEKDGIEIFIGDQSSSIFWKQFYEKIGKVDIVLDDGGHKNDQQIKTAINSIPNINDGGLLVVEDTHTSYKNEFGNPSKYSFISFSKKLIDDVNFTFPKLKKFNFSLNEYIYSIRFFESICIFEIDRSNCCENSRVINKGKATNNLDFRNKKSKFQNIKNKIIIKFPFLKKIILIQYIYRFLLNLYEKIQNYKLKKYFK